MRVITHVLLLSVVALSSGKPLSTEHVEYIPGTGLNVILSAPHGGYDLPEDIPRRTHGCWTGEECVFRHGCGVTDPVRCRTVTGRDSLTQEMTMELREELCNAFGRCPAVVINKVARSRFDANRDVDHATHGVPEMVAAWTSWHQYLNEAKAAMGGRGVYFDIHGHGHAVQQVELGYLVSGDDLDNNNLNPNASSIRHLAATSGSNFEALLRGERSLGEFIGMEGFPVVPAPGTPGPGGRPYFYGRSSYNTQRHGSRDGGVVDAIQIESCREHRDADIRPAYVQALARAIYSFVHLNYS